MNETTQNNTPRVLLVEDNAIVQKIHSTYLSYLGCQVDVASDGIEALEKANGEYKVIFMDVDIPHVNGIKVTKIIRFHERNSKKHVPIIFITAYGDEVKKECLEAGGDRVFAKPIDKEELAAILKQYCH
jgi:CheY-like chemotaxis protein